MIDGPISDDFFWFDESEPDSEFLDNDDDHFSSGSSDNWGWDEWGDLVVFRPIGHEPRYQYPLVVWLSVDDAIGLTLRDWFPDLSDRNYLGAEVSISPTLTVEQNANRVLLAIREIAAQYRVHRHRIWIAGVGPAADWVLRMLAECPGPVTGGVAISPSVAPTGVVTGQAPVIDPSKALYLATESGADREAMVSVLAERGLKPGQYACPEWESIDFSRLAVCRDLNIWLMQQVCTPAGHDSCE
ncbi:MAG: hypothetical protein U0929_18865 [Planctomycetaceae bacterium]